MNKYFMCLRMLERVSDISDRLPGISESLQDDVKKVVLSSGISDMKEYENKELELYNNILANFFFEKPEQSTLYYKMVKAISNTLQDLIDKKHFQSR